MQKKVLFAIGLAGLGGMVSPTTAQAQDNVTVVVNDGKVKSNSISGVESTLRARLLSRLTSTASRSSSSTTVRAVCTSTTLRAQATHD